MPDLNEIAVMRVDSGATVPSRVPVSIPVNPSGMQFIVTGESGPLADRVELAEDIWGLWKTMAINAPSAPSVVAGLGAPVPSDAAECKVGTGTNASIFLPFLFNDDGIAIDATDEIQALGRLDSFTLTLTLADIVPDETLIVTVTLQGGAGGQDGGITFFLVGADSDERAANYSDNHQPTWDGTGFLQGTRAGLTVNGKSALPDRVALKDREFWVRRDDIAGDFASLTITGEDALESIATKTVTLTALYDPLLEDLDTQIKFGIDAEGLPIIWRISSTSRARDTIDLNLAARIV